MLIDVSYFTAGPRHILNAAVGTQSTEVNDAISNWIATLQPTFLHDMCGEEIGDELGEYLAQQEEGSFIPDERLDAVAERLKQSFADYVFFHIIRESSTQATITGAVRLKCANSYCSPLNRQVDAWNTMVDRNVKFAKWSQSDECEAKGIATHPHLLRKINRCNL